MSKVSRRKWLGSALAGAAALPALDLDALDALDAQPPRRQRRQVPATGRVAVRNRIHQSVARWCYPKIALDDLCRAGAEMGLMAIDLLKPEEWATPRKYGLICAMGYAGADDIYNGLNRRANLPAIERAFRKNIPLAAKLGVPCVICFAGARKGRPDDEGANYCIEGLRRLTPIAEDHGVTICMELLNSKIDHPGYMCDHTAWGVSVARGVNSPRFQLLYDIYHMQIMEGDLIRTIRTNMPFLAHFHTGGVPGRHGLNGHQEVRWDGVMRALVAENFQGYVAHEFIPLGNDPLMSLRRAVALCDV